MNKEISINNALWTIAIGLLIYILKEVVRFFSETFIHREKYKSEMMYPALVEINKKFNLIFQSFIDTYRDLNSYKEFDLKVSNILGGDDKELYKTSEQQRVYFNLEQKLSNLKDSLEDFNSLFNIHKMYFSDELFFKEIEFYNTVYVDNINYLKSVQKSVSTDYDTNLITNLISEDYKHKQVHYRNFKDQLENEISEKLKQKTLKDKVHLLNSSIISAKI